MRPSRRHQCAWAVALIGVGLAVRADGAEGSLVSLPMPGVKVRSGFQITLDTRGVAGNGYRPIRVRIAPLPPGPAPADRTLRIMMRPRGWGGHRAVAITSSVSIAQGATSGEAIFSIPQTTPWNQIEIESFEDGRFLRDLSIQAVGLSGIYYSSSPDSLPSIGIVHTSAPPLTFFPTVVPNPTPLIPRIVKFPGAACGVIVLLPGEPQDGVHFESSNLGMGVDTVRSKTLLPTFPLSTNGLPDIRLLSGCFPSQLANNGANTGNEFLAKNPTTDGELRNLIAKLPSFAVLSPDDLPDEWLQLTSYDVLVFSLSELKRLSNRPAQWTALRQWLASGTTLFVYDIGGSFERLQELEALLGADPLIDSSAANGPRGWTKPEDKHFTESIAVAENMNGQAAWQQRQIRAQQTKNGQVAIDIPKPPAMLPFVYRAVGQGYVAAIAAENPFPGTEHGWSALFNALPSRNWLAHHRLGVSQYQDNEQFWNFLILGIGRAPVKSFLALISLFAIVIGPVNYFLLNRSGRLYWLLVTVPCGAFAVSSGLFLYAMIGDGLQTRVRARSFTELNQRTGESITFSRQTYYAGVAPSRGLSFPANAAVYPVEHRPVSRFGSVDTSRHIAWTDNQDLIEGYVLSRTMSQFVVIEPQTSEARLRIQEGADGLTAQNELGQPIARLVVCDSRSRLFTTQDLPVGVEQSLVAWPSDTGPSIAAWRTELLAAQPAYPEGYDPRAMEDVSGFFTGARYYNSSTVGAPRFGTSVLETELRSALDNSRWRLEPRTYLALVKKSPFVSLGVTSIGEEIGFHLIRGKF